MFRREHGSKSVRVRGFLPSTVAVALLVGVASAAGNPVHAQQRGDGFLFAPPLGSVTVSSGFSQARGASDIFADTREFLTLESGDFSSFSLSLEYARRLRDRLELFGGIGYAGISRDSEFRDWVDGDNLPITQRTTFTRIPLTVGARYYLGSTGRSIGQLAWLPNAISPYISAGSGLIWYSFQQDGDFVDFQDEEIFNDSLESSAFSPLLHAGAGADVTLSPSLALALEARYYAASAKMGQDFVGYDRIDLSGLHATIGLRIRY